MCDCYTHKCEQCDEQLPVHLGDFETERSEISVYCNKHIPEKGVRVFTVSEADEDYPVGWKMAIRYLTDNARERAEENCPNLSVDCKMEDKV
jgi:hypothetical protein